MQAWWASCLAYWTAGGPVLIPLAAVCLAIWAYFLRSRDRMVAVLREGRRLERDVAAGAVSRPVADSGPVASFLVRVLRDIRGGAAPRAAFHAREAECLEGLRRDVTVLAALTAVAPLLGLLGTVAGMVTTFDAVADVMGHTGARAAGGIRRALITTQFGLIIAVPGVFGVARLAALLADVQVTMGALRAQWLAQHAQRGRGGPS